jgi:hypothetical protein
MHRRRNLQPGVSPAAVALVPPVYPPRPRWATPRPSQKPAGRATRRRQNTPQRETIAAPVAGVCG